MGPLPADRRLSAVFTPTALSPKALENLEEQLARDQYPVRTLAGKTAKGVAQEGTEAEIRSKEWDKKPAFNMKITETKVCSVSPPSVWEEWNY